MIIHVKDSTHLGDCLFQLEFLSKLKQLNKEHDFILHCQEQYRLELMQDYPNANIDSIRTAPANAYDCWIGKAPRKIWLNRFYNEKYFEWFNKIVKDLNEIHGTNLVSPMKIKEDMMFSNPEIYKPNKRKADVLLIDAQPRSGQFAGFTLKHFDELEEAYEHYGYSVLRTSQMNTTLIEIARCDVKIIHGIHTSPLLMCLNFNNMDKKFIVYDRINHFNFFENYIPINNEAQAKRFLEQFKKGGKEFIERAFKIQIEHEEKEREFQKRFGILQNVATHKQ